MLCPHAEEAMRFLQRIGLQVDVVPGAHGFIEHVAVLDGGLQVDPAAPVSGLLHEAGHLAVVPSRFRSYLSGDITAGMKRIMTEVEKLCLEPDSQLERAVIQSGDSEATAWAFAAGRSIGIPDDQIIMDDDYFGEGDFIRLALAMNSYLGIHGLSHAGFCVPRATKYRPLPVYPSLAFWLQP